jgi:alpha-amylase
MASVCFYFQVHQPFRLKEYSFFHIGRDYAYENHELNLEVLNKVSDKCYIKSNAFLLDLIKKNKGKFKVAFSISGVALEQFEKYRPDVLASFQDLAKTGCVEFLGETYYHTLAALYSAEEFQRQVDLHKAKIFELFGLVPSVFRNTELIYNDNLAIYIQKHGYIGLLCEGAERLIANNQSNRMYSANNEDGIAILARNYKLSDDISFRFSDKNWKEWPLTASKFTSWLEGLCENKESIFNLFMDYETFGEHQWEGTGIFDFLKEFPQSLLANKLIDFKTPSEIINKYKKHGVVNAPETISWADSERDMSAWQGNSMQYECLEKIYSLEDKVIASKNVELIDCWSKLQTSDHFYYMSTKHSSDGAVHSYFSPYNTPHDAYLYYINIIADFEIRLNKLTN